MKTIIHAFINSIKMPHKKSVFNLNRIRMDQTVFYLFLLLAIASIPELIAQTIINPIQTVEVRTFIFFIYFFIVYYFILTLLIFIVISVIAFLAKLFAQIVGRKLHYSILWKMTAFASTIPLSLFTIITFFLDASKFFIIFALLYMSLVLVKVVFLYPRQKSIHK